MVRWSNDDSIPRMAKVDMKVGDLVRFGNIRRYTESINNRVGIFLGDRPIHREDGVTINNFVVWMMEDGREHICDNGMRKWLIKINLEKNEKKS